MKVGICSMCGRLGYKMHLHHFTERDTILLCHRCHFGEHGRVSLPPGELLKYVRLVNKYFRKEPIGFNAFTIGLLARARRVSKEDKKVLRLICDRAGISWSLMKVA